MKRPVISGEYRLLRELAEIYGAEDHSSSDRAALFRGFRSVQDKQKFAEKAARIVGPDNIGAFQGEIAVNVIKFVDPRGTTKKMRRPKGEAPT